MTEKLGPSNDTIHRTSHDYLVKPHLAPRVQVKEPSLDERSLTLLLGSPSTAAADEPHQIEHRTLAAGGECRCPLADLRVELQVLDT